MSVDRAGGHSFATLLRQRRRAAGLTQAELARRAGLAERTVRELERGRTTRPQRTTGALLADALGLTGEERGGFLGAARGEAPPGVAPHPGAVSGAVASVGAAAATLPGAGRPLWGREHEVTRLVDLLAGPAGGEPLALVGVAGVGKTALALAVARRLSGRLPGGAAWLAVDQHTGAAEIRAAVAGAAGSAAGHGAGTGGTVTGGAGGGGAGDGGAGGGGAGDGGAEGSGAEGSGYPGGGSAGVPALLVVDAVDRAPAEVRAALAQPPPALRVITTGRAPLGLPGERVWPVTPLELPPAGAADLAEVAGYPAAALFLDRLARVRPQPPAADEVPALVGLVRRLGGLPLALELAAAHARLLRLPEILQRYGDRVLDLAGGGDQTLREAVAGSYQLLCGTERAALCRLAAFRNWWSLELAEQLLGEGDRPVVEDPLPVLDRLVSLGLVRVRDAREHRFRLLDVVRDFAAEQAERQGELVPARRAHAAVVARLVARTAAGLAGPDQLAAAGRLDEVGGEVWAALNHAANDDPHTALRLAAALPRWWRLRGRDQAGRRWVRRLLDDPRTADADPAVRAWAMLGVAQLALAHGDGAAEEPAATAALAEFRRLGDPGGELVAGCVLGAVSRAAGRFDDARGHLQAVLAGASRHGRARDAAVAQLGLAWHEIRLGNLSAAGRRLAVADRLAARGGDQRLRMLAAVQSSEVARLAGRHEEAVSTGQRVLPRVEELGDPRHRRRVLGTLGRALARLGRLAEAERVLARLRGLDPPGRPGPAEGPSAAIEAQVALARGDRPRAVERLAAAVAALRSGEDQRVRVEVLVELAGCLAEPDPSGAGGSGSGPRLGAVLVELDRACRAGGFVLLERERAVVARATSRSGAG